MGNLTRKKIRNVILCKIKFGKTYDQKRRELVVRFDEYSVTKAEVAFSRFIGAITPNVLFHKSFEACCFAVDEERNPKKYMPYD